MQLNNKLLQIKNYYYRCTKKLNILVKSRYKIVKVHSFKNYSEEYDDIDFTSLSNNRKTYVFPIHFFTENDKLPIEYNLDDLYYAKIIECKIIGQSNVILTKNNFLLYDYLYDKVKSYVNVTDGGLLLLFNRVIHFKQNYILNYLQESPVRIENGILLSGNFSNNYFHFVFEFLVKFHIISKLSIDTKIPIIIDNHVKRVSQFEELITIFNKENRKLIYIQKGNLYTINELHYFSFINNIPPNLKRKIYEVESTDYAFDFDSINFLKTTIKEHFNRFSLETPKKIFVSRNDCLIRRNNETDIYPILHEHGFVIIQPEKMSIKEQYFHFANAQHIIAASGAALTNIIFCKPNCKILVLQSVKSQITIFSSIAAYLKTDMQYITPTIDELKSHPDFHIPKELLKQYLSKHDN